MKRNYNTLGITYKPEDREAISSAIPQRGQGYGWSRGGLTYQNSYRFDPPLTSEEMSGLLIKLIDAGAKKITFCDERSLGEKD